MEGATMRGSWALIDGLSGHSNSWYVVHRRQLKAQLWLILGDGVNQAADLASGATSIPS
jgi:hypothetical protein